MQDLQVQAKTLRGQLQAVSSLHSVLVFSQTQLLHNSWCTQFDQLAWLFDDSKSPQISEDGEVLG
jgi:hypothetical protein